MNVETILKETLHLSEYQILVYSKLLEKEATAGQLLRRLHISRASLYRVIDELLVQGILIKHVIGKRLFFEAVHPDHLLDLFKKEKISYEEKQHQLEKAVNELIIRAQKKPTDASISIEKGIQAHYRYMKLELTSKEKIIRQKINNDTSIYSYTKYPEGGSYDVFLETFLRDSQQQGLTRKILTHANTIPAINNYNVTNFEQLKEVHILPSEILPNISFKVFDDYSIFTLRDNNPEDMTVICIRNRTTADFLKAFFDFVFDRSIATLPSYKVQTLTTKENVVLPKLGIGTAGVGGYWDHFNPYLNEISDLDQLRHALGRGLHYIDTCLMYGEGRAVDLVARAIANIPRASLFITAKATRIGGKTIDNVRDIEKQCDMYLKKLNIPYLDLFEIHGKRTLTIPKAEAVEAIGNLITAGKVKYWGVCNYGIEHLKEVSHVIKEPIFANEVPYGVYDREYEQNGTLEYMRKNNILHIAYFSIRHGGFMIDESDGEEPLVQIGKKYNKTPTQIALNWVINHENTMAIVKSTNGTHINENVGAMGWKMEEEDKKRINGITD